MSFTVKASLTVLLVAVYASLSHYFLVRPALQTWAAAWAVLPLLALLIVFVSGMLARRWELRLAIAIVLVLIGAALLLQYWPHITRNNDMLYFLQHVSTNALLAVFFGRTLLKGKTALITQLATAIHGELPAHVVTYTRKVTIAWTVFFLVNALISVALFAAAPLHYWSIFGNLLNWPLVALMFALEYGVRKRVVKDFKPANIRQSIVAYMQQQGHNSKST